MEALGALREDGEVAFEGFGEGVLERPNVAWAEATVARLTPFL